MSYPVTNAVIMAAGTSSRFAPLSYEKPKGLTVVKGEVLIERQIRQLRAAGVPQIVLVVGYKKEAFQYLEDAFGVILIENAEYLTRNNNGSIWAARDYLKNSYICSSDNYFSVNPFEATVDESYYAGVFAEGNTQEWCMTEDAEGYVDSVTIGGKHAWYMLGHAFWSEMFSHRFLDILSREYALPETTDKLWEKIYMEHLDELKMKLRKYPEDAIFEFDTMDELRAFDASYWEESGSPILKSVALKLGCAEREITQLTAFRDGDNSAAGFRFVAQGQSYEYRYENQNLRRISFYAN